MVKIAVAGIAGRMGVRLAHAVQANPQAELTAAFEAPGHEAVGKGLAEVTGLPGAKGVVQDNPSEALQSADVLIDFTAPQATLANVQACLAAKKACVIGTTGMTSEDQAVLKKAAEAIPMVFAPNMSVGMNLMFKLAGMIAGVLGQDYALEMIEAHHDQKKDAPSGTAVRLLDELAKSRGWDAEKAAVMGRKGMIGARPTEEIGVSVIRGGDIVGDHTILYIGQGERIELTHRAHSRDTFAGGAVRAALWLGGKQAGLLYDMQDVLGLKG